MDRYILFTLAIILIALSSCEQKKNTIVPGELDLHSMIQPFGGPVVHLTAIAENPNGPFVKQNNPIFTAQDLDFPAEDPFVWFQDNCYYAIVKDMQGAFTKAGRSLVLFYSLDGLDWKLAKNPLVSDLNIKMADGSVQKLEALERPQLFFEDGKLVALLCSVNETLGHSYNIQIPLKTP